MAVHVVRSAKKFYVAAVVVAGIAIFVMAVLSRFLASVAFAGNAIDGEPASSARMFFLRGRRVAAPVMMLWP